MVAPDVGVVGDAGIVGLVGDAGVVGELGVGAVGEDGTTSPLLHVIPVKGSGSGAGPGALGHACTARERERCFRGCGRGQDGRESQSKARQ